MLKAMIKRALNVPEENVLLNKTFQCLDKEGGLAQKSRHTMGEDDAMEWLKPRQLMKPDEQEEVAEADLTEEVGRVLTTINPSWILDEVAYHYGRHQFLVKPKPTFGKAYPLLIIAGTAIRKDSEEAKAQICAGYGMVGFDDAGPKKAKVKKVSAEEEEEEEKEAPPPPAEDAGAEEDAAAGDEKPEEPPPKEEVHDVVEEAAPEAVADEEEVEADDGGGGGGEAGALDTALSVLDIKPRVKKLANQFNFCERAALTYNNPRRNERRPTPRVPVDGA